MPLDTDGSLFKDVNALRHNHDPTEEELAEIAAEKFNDTIFAVIAQNKVQEIATLSVILFNALFIGFDTDYSARFDRPDKLYDPDMPIGFPILENFFCIYFTLEVLIRYHAFRNKLDVFHDGWMMFDGTLVFIMILETWVLSMMGGTIPIDMSMLRLLRLLRITRMGKLMRFFPELQIIVKGMMAAVRSVSITFALLIIILYVFSIMFTDAYHQGKVTDEEVSEDGAGVQAFFGSMGKSMRHLIIMGTILDDMTACTNAIRASGSKAFPMLMVFFVFVLVSSFTMLNMLIGLLCEVVTATAEGEKEKGTELAIKEAIGMVFASLDADNSGSISRKEFMSMAHDKSVLQSLSKLEVETKHFDMFADLMFVPTEEGGPIPNMNLDDTVSMITRLRPGSKVGALDFASFQQSVCKNHAMMKYQINRIDKMMCKVITYDPEEEARKQRILDGEIDEESEKEELTLEDLEHFEPDEMFKELQRRKKRDGTIHTATFGDANMLMQKFQTLFCPVDDSHDDAHDAEAWGKETYNC